MKRKGLLLLALAALAAGGAFAQKVGDTVQAGGQSYTIQSVSGDTFTAKRVSPSSVVTFTTIAEFKAWLDSQPDNSKAKPYKVKINISDLNGSYNRAGSLGSVFVNKINANKYVDLDLSDSTFTSMERFAFCTCSTIISVILPNSVTDIEQNIFDRCTNLESVTFGNRLTKISYGCFAGCSSLTSVTIPANVQRIEQDALRIPSLNSVTFKGTIPFNDFISNAFTGDMKNKFYATNKENGTPGTYTKSGDKWTKS
jgi:hypothetical protein